TEREVVEACELQLAGVGGALHAATARAGTPGVTALGRGTTHSLYAEEPADPLQVTVFAVVTRHVEGAWCTSVAVAVAVTVAVAVSVAVSFAVSVAVSVAVSFSVCRGVVGPWPRINRARARDRREQNSEACGEDWKA